MEKVNSSIHTMIIWSKVIRYKEEIIKQLELHFEIIKIVNVTWNRRQFVKNYRVFYSHSLKEYTESRTKSILIDKEKTCGNKNFYVVVFEDKYPIFEDRQTSSGNRIVNINVFDLKTKFRKLVGGGSKIHASDDAWETNKDLTLLFGLNIQDFLKKYKDTPQNEIKYKKDCVGVHGYSSIEEFFYVLNNCIDYCVLRNFESLPDQYTIEGHGDIDLLVSNKNYMRRLTCAIPWYPQSYRVYHKIKIAGQMVSFDFRYIGDNYYDYRWERDILKNRKFIKSLFYVPDDVNHYYSLLYHAYIQKRQVNLTYPPVLNELSEIIGKKYNEDQSATIKQLDSFLSSKEYFYTKPNDKSVYHNMVALSKSKYYVDNGYTVKVLFVICGGIEKAVSSVNESENCFIKRGETERILNERDKLSCLENIEGFPKLLDDKVVNNSIKLSKLEGVDADSFLSSPRNINIQLLNSFIIGVLRLITQMRRCKIIHRDIQPSNILVVKEGNNCRIGIIDFGWSIFDDEIDCCEKPQYLCVYKNREFGGELSLSSDYYSLGKIVEYYLSKIPYYSKISDLLINMSQVSVNTSDFQDIENFLINSMPDLKSRIIVLFFRLYNTIKLRLKNNRCHFFYFRYLKN